MISVKIYLKSFASYFSLFLLLVIFLSTAYAKKRVISGDFEYGEKYTDNFVAPSDEDVSQDDYEFDRYVFRNSWLQYDHPIQKSVKVSIRIQESEKDFSERAYLNNSTKYAQIRMTLEPKEGWAIWPHVSMRIRDYVKNSIDNDITIAGCEARYRWDIRHNVRFGTSWTSTQYRENNSLDRQAGSAFISYERPLSEGLTLRLQTRAEQTSFERQSALRENSAKGSASVGFRYEF